MLLLKVWICQKYEFHIIKNRLHWINFKRNKLPWYEGGDGIQIATNESNCIKNELHNHTEGNGEERSWHITLELFWVNTPRLLDVVHKDCTLTGKFVSHKDICWQI